MAGAVTMPPWPVMNTGKVAQGSIMVSTTASGLVGSTATLSMFLKAMPTSTSARSASKKTRMASPSRASPLWKVTSGRAVMVHVRLSAEGVIDSAR